MDQPLIYEKEIYEQTQILGDSLRRRLNGVQVYLDELDPDWLKRFSSVMICACETSYHAGMVASYLFERSVKLPVQVAIASEFRYREPVLSSDALFVVISQSGETADTLDALKQAKAQQLSTLALCNVDNSSIIREADVTLLLRTGIEKSVASTKAFSS